MVIMVWLYHYTAVLDKPILLVSQPSIEEHTSSELPHGPLAMKLEL